jgi:hypothetical protein
VNVKLRLSVIFITIILTPSRLMFISTITTFSLLEGTLIIIAIGVPSCADP